MARTTKRFQETVKYFKKMTKVRYWVQFAEDKTYISEGHFIAVMPTCFYDTYIIPSVAGMPRYNKEDTTYEIENGELKFSTVNFKQMLNDKSESFSIETKPTTMLFEIERNRIARGFIWNNDGEYTGALINEEYFKVSKDFSDGNGKYRCTKKTAPIITSSYDDEFIFMVLPIHYDYDTDFQMIIDALNKPEIAEKAA